MKKFKPLGISILIVSIALLVYSCAQVVQVTPTAAGYKVYSGTDPGGRAFSFEYPDGWTASEETLTSSWNSGKWIMFKGPGDWQTGGPVLSLWIAHKEGTLTDEASYKAAAYSDRNVSPTGGAGPGLISEAATTETVAGLTAEGWRINYRTQLPIGRIYEVGDIEYDDLMAGELVTAESEWRVFEKGDYVYDLNFAAIGDKLSSREAYLHAINTFRFD
ncbi:hypothetical protein A3D23_00485 [candidate division WOR-1 bacterium RIFCSPHIGHO2_02_FULL_53_26]|nr:MAG: hypothetical protein A3D23_00485 [candidate division WOR-1 bacterium RIFCSPHIGHO2_02_FULL_53_26]